MGGPIRRIDDSGLHKCSNIGNEEVVSDATGFLETRYSICYPLASSGN